MKYKSTPIPDNLDEIEFITKGVFLTMLLSTMRLGFMAIKNDKFLKSLIVISIAMLIWYIGRVPTEFYNITAWTPTFILVDIGAAITSICLITFVVLYILVKRKLKKLGFSSVIEWLKKDC